MERSPAAVGVRKDDATRLDEALPMARCSCGPKPAVTGWPARTWNLAGLLLRPRRAGRLVSSNRISGQGHRSPSVAWSAVNSTSRQALDMRKRHVDRCCHRCHIARSLGQHVSALKGGDEPGRELVRRRLGRKRTSVLKPTQYACQKSLPFGEQLRQGLAGDIVVSGYLRGQGTERTTVGAMP